MRMERYKRAARAARAPCRARGAPVARCSYLQSARSSATWRRAAPSPKLHVTPAAPVVAPCQMLPRCRAVRYRRMNGAAKRRVYAVYAVAVRDVAYRERYRHTARVDRSRDMNDAEREQRRGRIDTRDEAEIARAFALRRCVDRYETRVYRSMMRITASRPADFSSATPPYAARLAPRPRPFLSFQRRRRLRTAGSRLLLTRRRRFKAYA